MFEGHVHGFLNHFLVLLSYGMVLTVCLKHGLTDIVLILLVIDIVVRLIIAISVLMGYAASIVTGSKELTSLTISVGVRIRILDV